MPPAPASPRRPRLDRTVAHVCLCAFLLQCKPSEPHLVPYLTDVKGFSSAQVETDILPVSVYASLVFFLLAGPAASATSTKTVLVVGGACKLLTRVLLLWGRTLGAMRLMQVTFAAGAASDLMLYAYLAETSSFPPRDADLDVVRDAPSPDEDDAQHRASLVSDAPVSESSRVRFATGAASASALLGYMLAAELGQIAYERGASYESLFAASLVAVALGCVGVATLPGDGDGAAKKRKRDAGGNADARAGASTSSAFSPAPALGDARFWEKKKKRKRKPLRARLVDAVAAACASCYGSTSAIALSAWWVIGTPPASTLETYVLSLLSDVEEGGNDSGGHVVFFARAASAAAAAWRRARRSRWRRRPRRTRRRRRRRRLVRRSSPYPPPWSQPPSRTRSRSRACTASPCSRSRRRRSRGGGAARRGLRRVRRDGGCGGSRFGNRLRVGRGASSGFAFARDGIIARWSEKGDDGLLFGLNSFFALVVLVLARASVDASRGGARGAAAAAAAVAALAAAVVVFAAVARRFSSGADWAFAPTPSDVSFEWLMRLSRSCE